MFKTLLFEIKDDGNIVLDDLHRIGTEIVRIFFNNKCGRHQRSDRDNENLPNL